MNRLKKRLQRAKHVLHTRLLHTNFTFDGKRYKYFRHPYNNTPETERIAEIAIFRRLLEESTDKVVLEVGNVMNHYGNYHHTVVDKFEKGEGVVTSDVMDYRPDQQFDLIISISTIEHIGFDESVSTFEHDGSGAEAPDNDKIPEALKHIRGLLKPGGKLIVSLPTGFNPNLDKIVKADQLGASRMGYLRRRDAANTWEEASREQVIGMPYHQPYPHANGMIIAEFDPS